jgi:hypothetical protein
VKIVAYLLVRLWLLKLLWLKLFGLSFGVSLFSWFLTGRNIAYFFLISTGIDEIRDLGWVFYLIKDLAG